MKVYSNLGLVSNSKINEIREILCQTSVGPNFRWDFPGQKLFQFWIDFTSSFYLELDTRLIIRTYNSNSLFTWFSFSIFNIHLDWWKYHHTKCFRIFECIALNQNFKIIFKVPYFIWTDVLLLLYPFKNLIRTTF